MKEILKRINKSLESKRGYFCQWCGHKELAPKGGICPNSPNNHHQYIKASIDDKNECMNKIE